MQTSVYFAIELPVTATRKKIYQIYNQCKHSAIVPFKTQDKKKQHDYVGNKGQTVLLGHGVSEQIFDSSVLP